MDLNHPLLQAGPSEPQPFPTSFPQLRRLDRSVLCPICKEGFQAPVSIACGHSFCSACIRSSLDHQKKCPSCGEPAKEGSIRRNRALEEIADAWEAARPALLEFTKPVRKRARESGSAGPSKRARGKRASGGEGGGSDSRGRSLAPSDDEVEIIDSVEASDDDVQELSENDEAPCPICGAQLEIASIPGHIERGCPPPKAKASGSGSGNAKADWRKVFSGAGGKPKASELKRIVKPNYSLTGTGELRALLTEHGLPTSGDRGALEARFQEWTILYNANMDTERPCSLSALRAKLAGIEAARKRDRDKGKDDEVAALQSKEGLQRYARDQRAEFERLRQDVLDRKARKDRGGADGDAVDTAIEVE